MMQCSRVQCIVVGSVSMMIRFIATAIFIVNAALDVTRVIHIN